MKKENLSDVLAALRRVRTHPRMEHVQERNLQKVARELEVLGRSGKLDKRRVFRVAEILCDAVVAAWELAPEREALSAEASETPSDDNE